jgi:tRNA 2-thiouridine synthesizing protein A
MSRSERTIELVDTRGTFCPVPILLAARQAKKLTVGDRLQLLGDDPAMLRDVPAWCQASGHRLVSMVEKSPDIDAGKAGEGAGATGLPAVTGESGSRRTIHCIIELSTPTLADLKLSLD